MKLRCYKVVFPVAFRAEVLGVLIAVLPVGVFAASTMNNGRWFHQEPSIEHASSVPTAASGTGLDQAHYGSHDSIAEEQEREPEPNSGTAEPRLSRAIEGSVMDEVDQYLWAVYERSPTKQRLDWRFYLEGRRGGGAFGNVGKDVRDRRHGR